MTSVVGMLNSKVDLWKANRNPDGRGGDRITFGFEASPIGTPDIERIRCRVHRAGQREREQAGQDSNIVSHLVYFGPSALSADIERDDVFVLRKWDRRTWGIGQGPKFRVLAPRMPSESAYVAWLVEQYGQ